MFIKVLDLDGLLALLLAILAVAYLRTRRFVFPRIVYRLGAMSAFCGWLVFCLSGGTMSYSGGAISVIRDWYVTFAPFLLPLEAGYLEWAGLELSSRWLLLEFVLGAALSPYLAAWVIHILS